MEEIVILILISFGTAFGFIALWKVFDMVRSSIKSNKVEVSADDFDRLARAFMQHKKEMQERIQHIETIISDDKKEGNNLSQIEAPKEKLDNELKQKDKVRS